MKIQYSRILLTALLLITLVGAAQARFDPIPGQVVVSFKTNQGYPSFAEYPDLVVIDSIPAIHTYLVSTTLRDTTEGVVKAAESSPLVEFAQPNYCFELPNVNQMSIGFPDQDRPIFLSGTEPQSYFEQPGVYSTGIDSAQLLASGHNIIVAVIDNGINYEHPLMIASAVLPGRDFVDRDNDASEEEGATYGHGTFVSGLILLTAPECKILPARAFSSDGFGTEFAIAQAIYWALEHNVQIINMSFGTQTPSNLIRRAIRDARNAGVLIVASTGNDGDDIPQYPSAYPEVLAVSSFDTLEVIADFSCYGPHVEISAPGVNLYSAYAGEYEWATWSGTSFSAALVSGTAALIKSRSPQLRQQALRDRIVSAARTEMLWGEVGPKDMYYGAGALDALSAVLSVCLGDVDGSGILDISDLTLLIELISAGGGPGGDEPVDPDKLVGDMNRDGATDETDVSILSRYLFARQLDSKLRTK